MGDSRSKTGDVTCIIGDFLQTHISLNRLFSGMTKQKTLSNCCHGEIKFLDDNVQERKVSSLPVRPTSSTAQ